MRLVSTGQLYKVPYGAQTALVKFIDRICKSYSLQKGHIKVIHNGIQLNQLDQAKT